jgi:predicted GNAT family acetyltransferase
MEVRELADPVAFLAASEDLLLAAEARHNLLLGIAGTLRDHPGVHREHRLWVVEDGGVAVGAALRTPPYNLVVARPVSKEALVALATAIDDVHLPGVSGAIPEVEVFAAAWESRVGATRRRRMSQRIYKVTEVRPPVGVPGDAREATVADRDLVISWFRAFTEEAVPDTLARADLERSVDARLVHGAGGFVLWEDGEAVSLAGWGGQTPNGVRVGPVYTPPRHRRRGYGSAITAAVSAERLASGRRFCCLYTDLENPTSNSIYMDIGYDPVCDSVDYAFVPA